MQIAVCTKFDMPPNSILVQIPEVRIITSWFRLILRITRSKREIETLRKQNPEIFKSDGFHVNRSMHKIRRDLKLTFWSQKSKFNSARSQISVSALEWDWCYFIQSNALEYQLRVQSTQKEPHDPVTTSLVAHNG